MFKGWELELFLSQELPGFTVIFYTLKILKKKIGYRKSSPILLFEIIAFLKVLSVAI